MTISKIAAFVAIVGIVGGLSVLTVRAQERQECARWSADSRYTVAGWQIEQCAAYGVALSDHAAQNVK